MQQRKFAFVLNLAPNHVDVWRNWGIAPRYLNEDTRFPRCHYHC